MIHFIRNIPYPIRVVVFFILGMLIASMSAPLGWGPLYWIDSLWPALLAMMMILYWPIRWEAILDAEKIEEGRKILHGVSAVLRLLGILGVSAILNAHFWHWPVVLDLTIFGCCWYGIVFNYHLNLERNLPAFYLPKGDRDGGSTIDQIFNNLKHGGEVLVILELLGMLLTGYIYIKQY